MLETGELLQRAEAQTGLSDWGEDQTFRIGLDAFVSALNSAGLPSAGIERATARILHLLSIRLHLRDDEKQHPEICEQPIEAPLILTGLARTGTTILHNLCALDPEGRYPQEWEAASPWPAPETATYGTDPRIAQTDAALQTLLTALPALRTMHPWGAQLPADCLNFLAQHFVCSSFVANFHVPEYSRWLATQYPDGLYRTHKRALQQLQWKGPQGRWILKEPQHLLNLGQLVDVYPDVALVQTHRDPLRTLPSVASLIWTIQSLTKPDLDKHETGRQVLELFGAHLQRSLDARKSAGVGERILDIAYRDTVLDPVGVVRRINEHFGRSFSDEHARRINAYMAQNPQGKHGEHRYSAEEYGLDEATLRAMVPEYRERFGHLLDEPQR